MKTGTIGSTNSTQSFQTQIVENQGAPFSLPLCATEKPTAGPAAGLQGVQQDRAHTQDVAPCGKFDKFDESSESIAELAEQKLLKPEPSGMPHPLGRIALETIPRPNLESGPAQLCGLGTSIMDSAHHAHESQEAIPTFEASPDLCGDAGDANVCNQSLAPPEFERKIADASGPFCDGARDACEPGSPTHAESLVSATATCNDGAPLDMVLDVQPQPDDVAGVERNSLDNKGCHSDHPELGKHNHCSGQDGCGNGTDRPHDHDCSDEQDQQVDKSGNCNSPHVCADRKCEQGVKNTGSVNQPGAQELEATERKRILTRMFRWPFFCHGHFVQLRQASLEPPCAEEQGGGSAGCLQCSAACA